MKNVYVVTHTESVHHIEQQVGGWFDTGLTERGRAQASLVRNRLVELLGSEKPTITSSDLARAKQTAEIVAGAFACPVKVSRDLRELSAGMAEGKPQDWLDTRFVPAPDDIGWITGALSAEKPSANSLLVFIELWTRSSPATTQITSSSLTGMR